MWQCQAIRTCPDLHWVNYVCHLFSPLKLVCCVSKAFCYRLPMLLRAPFTDVYIHGTSSIDWTIWQKIWLKPEGIPVFALFPPNVKHLKQDSITKGVPKQTGRAQRQPTYRLWKLSSVLMLPHVESYAVSGLTHYRLNGVGKRRNEEGLVIVLRYAFHRLRSKGVMVQQIFSLLD